MIKRTVFAATILALAAAAQDGPPPGRGRMGFGPPPPGGRGPRFLGAEPGMPGRVVKNAPYSADVVTESTQTLADGSHIRQSSTVKVYRDSDGRTRREQTANLGGLSTSASSSATPLVIIHDPVAGVSMALNANQKTGSRSRFMGGRGPGGGPPPAVQSGQAAARPHRQAPNNPNLKTESLGTRSFDGVLAEGRRTTLTIPAGQIGNEQPLQVVTETWYSSDLQTILYQKRSDPRNGETITHVSNVSRAEPARTLFEAPADYKITDAPQARARQ